MVANAQIPILQGPTTELKTEIIVLRKSSDSFRYEVNPEVIIEVKSYAPSPSSWVVDSVNVSTVNYLSSSALSLKIWKGDKKVDEREFSFLLPKEQIRVALVSCASDKFTLVGNKKPWESVNKTNPDLMLWLGDNVYAAYFDKINPTQYWNRFVETRRALGVFYWKKLVPSFAAWDDHDFGGGDNGDSTYEHREVVTQIFEAFFGTAEFGGDHIRGPGVSQTFVIGDHRFVMLDGRSFKSPLTTPLSERTLWGAEQLDWLNQMILTTESDLKNLWLTNGTKFFNTEPDGESLEKDQPEEYKELSQNLEQLILKDSLKFISGDTHYSEIIEAKIGENLVTEVTSSSIHSVRTPGSKIPESSRRKVGFYGDSFVVLELPTNGTMGMRATGHASSGAKEVFSYEF
jgi:hypothetical protein